MWFHFSRGISVTEIMSEVMMHLSSVLETASELLLERLDLISQLLHLGGGGT